MPATGRRRAPSRRGRPRGSADPGGGDEDRSADTLPGAAGGHDDAVPPGGVPDPAALRDGPGSAALAAILDQPAPNARGRTGPALDPAAVPPHPGNRHDALPRSLIEDPVLQPTDKVVWQVVRIGARAGEPIAFPGYRQILRAANIRPVSPVSRALAVLHVACWVTLCARVRDPRGGFRGNVYVLHDEPLGLADTLELDHGHMEFLDGVATDHAHRRVRDVAAAALATIAGRDLAHAARTARAALLSATGYRYLGITRDRVRLGTARALEVRSLMGEVPAELLDDPPAGPPDDPAGGSQRAL